MNKTFPHTHNLINLSHNDESLICIPYGPDDSPNGFEALESEWNQLLQRSRFDTIFLTYEWQTTWWAYLGTGELWILAFRRASNNELVSIIPLYRTLSDADESNHEARFTLVGCIEVSDYLDAIIAKGWESQVYTHFLKWLHSEQAPHWDILDLCNLPQDSLSYQHFPMICEQFELQAEISQEDVAPQFALPLHYASYLQDRVDKKQRHEIRRKQRRIERETEVDFKVVGTSTTKERSDISSDDLDREIDDFITLQRASREDKAEFMTPEMQRFFRAMAHRMAAAGFLRLCFLSLNGEKAAVLFAFEYNQRFLLYNSGYDPEAYAHLSPGWVILAYTIQYAIAGGCRLFDFMQGDEEYKYRFGSQEYKVMRTVVRR